MTITEAIEVLTSRVGKNYFSIHAEITRHNPRENPQLAYRSSIINDAGECFQITGADLSHVVSEVIAAFEGKSGKLPEQLAEQLAEVEAACGELEKASA